MASYGEKRGVYNTLTEGINNSEAAQIIDKGAEATKKVIKSADNLINNWQLIILGALALVIILKKQGD